MSGLVGNPEDRFSHNEAHISSEDYKCISISAPFKMDKIRKFKGHENEETFFRPSLRALLVLYNYFYLFMQKESTEVQRENNVISEQTQKGCLKVKGQKCIYCNKHETFA